MLLIIAFIFFFIMNTNVDSKETLDRNYFSFTNNVNLKDSLKGNTIEKFISQQLAKGEKPNKLINEKSPYLLQHAFNPVNWYPWGEEAFEKARKENKPIFLSVGYSTCYWCHVMEREVFENDSLAALLNKYFIAIKVDREERPDVDRIYMTALQAMTGHGGWPMTMFLTPDLKPFYGTSYIPAEPKYGQPGFAQLLNAIQDAWISRRDEINESSIKISEYIKGLNSADSDPVNVNQNALTNGYNSFVGSFDSENGGFSKAPKFPQPSIFNFLLQYYADTENEKALSMTLETLKKMGLGGIHDQIGGGFHRYSTDNIWQVPHFEKMLYDQAQLAITYLQAYQITKDDFYQNTARDILDYVSKNMTHPEGGFYSAEDAESVVDNLNPDVKEEGAFYTWHKNEIDKFLEPREEEIFDYYFGIKEKGNVDSDSDPHKEFINENILYVAHSLSETVNEFNLKSNDALIILSNSRKKLYSFREQRPKPHLDDKILVSWNGLMISAFAKAYQVLDDKKYLDIALNAGSFILNKLYNSKSKILLRRYRDGEARFNAQLNDYAFLIQGLLDLYESTFNIRWLENAKELNQKQIILFYDNGNGGFFDTDGSDANNIIRTKDWYDNEMPSGNSIAILNLLRLSQMTGDNKLMEIAQKSLAYFGERINQVPQAMPQFLVAVDFSLSKPKQIIIAGSVDDIHTKELLKEVHSHFIPNKIILLADGKDGQKTLASYIPFIESVKRIDGKSTAYICENYACQLPTSDVKKVAELLNK